MNWQRKVIYMVIGGLVVFAIAFAGAATFAQTDDNAESPSLGTDDAESGTLDFSGQRGNGRGERSQALADALGISLEELQTAHEEAKAAAIAQAVTDGLITQEQADEILAGNGRLGRGLHLENGAEYLADALGITVEELHSAMDEVHAARLAEMVAAGAITQEQADMIAARRAIESYVDREALQATIQAAYEDAINQALADGAITEEQAEALLSNIDNIGRRGFGGPGFGGRGKPHHGPRGGAGFAPFQNDNNSDSAPLNTDLDA